MREKERQLEKLKQILLISGISVFEYFPEKDRIVVYDSDFTEIRAIDNYMEYLRTETIVHPEDRWKVLEFYRKKKEHVELRVVDSEGYVMRREVNGIYKIDDQTGQPVLLGCVKDVTMNRERENILEETAKKDSLTGLYNQTFGQEAINDYLVGKDPYDSCALLIIDIDYFKNVNDTYGHLFGDEVLIKLADYLKRKFDAKDILIRLGGDEFVIFVKDISHPALVRKVTQLVAEVREIEFSEAYYSMTCSVGVCFLAQNISGYFYSQLLKNADWALYRSKENGKNRYTFCDHLQRYEMLQEDYAGEISCGEVSDIEARYLRNDIVATAFEIFEKMNSFDAAMELLMKVIGIRLHLDRITVIQTDVKGKNCGRQYQWHLEGIPEVLPKESKFSKEDFLTLFHGYDKHGTIVLQRDDMGMYSAQGAELLMQGEAKTVLYAAMYCEGKYVGAISYVVCGEKRYWSKQDRRQIGEVTKIISAHLSKKTALNVSTNRLIGMPGYDRLTGLLSFSRFREEAERLIVGGYATSHIMIFSDFENFKYFNRRYGYQTGDQLLKEFATYIISGLKTETDVYFTRVVADQFIIFAPYNVTENLETEIQKVNDDFIKRMEEKYPGAQLRLRSGIYQISPGCTSASMAIDAANYARKQVYAGEAKTVHLYDDKIEQMQNLENDVINGFDHAIGQKQFKVYYQPRFSLPDCKIVGAEALVRWEREDGTLLYPDVFIPNYETDGRIVELDFYVFEQAVAFLSRNQKAGRKLYPISVNMSVLHVADQKTVDRYAQILKQYDVDPSYIEIELTETAAVKDYQKVKEMFQSFQSVGIRTVLDDFGAGYSVLNSVIDTPVDAIKIDRKFLAYCTDNEKGDYFLRQICNMMQGLGYHLICEGVETREQADVLKTIGCKEIQGYWLAYPMKEEEYEKLLYPSSYI